MTTSQITGSDGLEAHPTEETARLQKAQASAFWEVSPIPKSIPSRIELVFVKHPIGYIVWLSTNEA